MIGTRDHTLGTSAARIRVHTVLDPSTWGGTIVKAGHFSSGESQLAGSKRIFHPAVSVRLNSMLRSEEELVLRHAVKGGGSTRAIISFNLLEQWTASASTKYKILVNSDILLAVRNFFHRLNRSSQYPSCTCQGGLVLDEVRHRHKGRECG